MAWLAAVVTALTGAVACWFLADGIRREVVSISLLLLAVGFIISWTILFRDPDQLRASGFFAAAGVFAAIAISDFAIEAYLKQGVAGVALAAAAALACLVRALRELNPSR